MVIPPEVLLLLRIVFGILGFLLFQMNLQIALSSSVKNSVGMLMGIALNLWIAFGKIAIFTILTLIIHEHGRPVHLLRSCLISFFRDLKFLSYRFSLP
jgi:ABC-type Co2+ transport system permease subunit